LKGAATSLILGYTFANQGFFFIGLVVATSLSAPPSRSTTWLFACHKSAIFSTFLGTSTLVPA
jgi:hypothetical protein